MVKRALQQTYKKSPEWQGKAILDFQILEPF